MKMWVAARRCTPHHRAAYAVAVISGPGGTSLWAILPRETWEKIVRVVQDTDLGDDGELYNELVRLAPYHWVESADHGDRTG